MAAPDYGYQHRKLRAHWKPRVEAGLVECWRCGNVIVPDHALKGHGWDLGHDDEDPTKYRGPEHATCNRGTNGRQERRIRSRDW